MGAGASLASMVRESHSKEVTLKKNLKVPRCSGQPRAGTKVGKVGMIEEQKEGCWGWTEGETGRR